MGGILAAIVARLVVPERASRHEPSPFQSCDSPQTRGRLLAAAGLHLKPNASFDGKRFPLVMPKKRVKGITYGPLGSKLVQDADLVGKAAAAPCAWLLLLLPLCCCCCCCCCRGWEAGGLQHSVRTEQG